MKKLFLMVALAAATVFTTVSAQKRTTVRSPLFSVGLELGTPTVKNSIYSIGIGGSGKIEIPTASNLFITVTAGYTSFYLKDNIKNVLRTFGQSTTPAGFVPLKAGGKYYFSPAFYAEGEIGATIGTNRGSGTAFAYAPGIGTSIPLIGKNAIDIGLRFEGWSQNTSFNQLGLRAAYKF